MGNRSIRCCFFIVLAVIYITVAKEKWTSSAIIAQPDAAQIATYSNALNILYGGAAPSMLDIQNRAIGRFNSSFSALAQALDNQEDPEKLTIEPTVKGQGLPLTVTYQGESAEAAQKQLAQYIQQVDEQTAKELTLDLRRQPQAADHNPERLSSEPGESGTGAKDLRMNF